MIDQVGAVGEPQGVGAGENLESGAGEVFEQVAGMTDVDTQTTPSMQQQRRRGHSP